MAWNFDLETGEFFAPEQLAEDGGAFSQAVQAEIVRQIHERAEENGMAAEEMFWSDYEEIAAGWSGYAVSFDEAGMTAGFSPTSWQPTPPGPRPSSCPMTFCPPILVTMAGRCWGWRGTNAENRGFCLLSLPKNLAIW